MYSCFGCSVVASDFLVGLTDELDSYMYQSVGHHAIDLYAEAMGLPLYRREIQGTSKSTERDYEPTLEDEVEDLYELLKTVKVINHCITKIVFKVLLIYF